MKVVTILIPSFQGLRLERLGAYSPFCDGPTKKKTEKKDALLDSPFAEASSSN